ncbi:MAG: leucine-rich repeat domain-containing protein [Treponema sp.]|nr:leucine-rich repeat domain-containing protein [Treponema sp.]
MEFVRKNGLFYTEDMRSIVGVDAENAADSSTGSVSGAFTGRVPFGVHFIEDEVFAGCSYDYINLPDSIEQLGACLFENSKKLTKVKLPANIKELPPYLFSGCSKLVKVEMPNVVNAFSEGLFNGCSSLPEIPFRAGIKELPELVFAGCSSIQSVVIPATVTKIGNQAFANCTSLTAVVLPAQLKEIADDAFEGCGALRNIRISDDNPNFYVGEDGNLYESDFNGNGKCVIRVSSVEKQVVNFFNDTIAEVTIEAPENNLENDINGSATENGIGEAEDYKFFADENFGEGADYENDTFSSEITDETDSNILSDTGETTMNDSNIDDLMSDILGDIPSSDSGTESTAEVGISADELALVLKGSSLDNNSNKEKQQEVEDMTEQTNNSGVDAIFADIMGEEKARTGAVTENVAVDEKESQVLAEMMDCMNDKASSAKVSDEELANLFSSNETSVLSENESTDSDDKIDNRTQILLDSAQLSKVIECTPTGEVPLDGDLFVIAEILAQDPSTGEKIFTPKLEKCCQHFAHIQDFRRIIMLAGLPVDNEEFMQFFYHFMSMRNVIVACEAPSPSKLSAYAKTICDSARISLEKNDLLEQRKKISIKNSTLIKLVIQDFMAQ